MLCPNCGRQLPDGIQYCQYCGNTLEGGFDYDRYSVLQATGVHPSGKAPKGSTGGGGKAAAIVVAVIVITVVLAGIMYVSVSNLSSSEVEVTPSGSLYVRESSSQPGTYSLSIVALSDEVGYREFYIAINTEYNTIVIGDSSYGLATSFSGSGTLYFNGPTSDTYGTYASVDQYPSDGTKLSAGDVMTLTTYYAANATYGYGDYWDGSEVRYIHIPTGGLICQKTIY